MGNMPSNCTKIILILILIIGAGLYIVESLYLRLLGSGTSLGQKWK
jgi:hypothetical protein